MINIVFSILPVICFIAGFCFGFKIKTTDKLPEIKTPVQILEEHQEKVKIKEEATKLGAYLDNIDNYPYNQKEIKE